MIDHGNRQLAKFWRAILEFGRWQKVAERGARIERADRNGEIAARRRGQAGGGLGLGVDQQRGEVGGGHLDVADDELGHKHRAVDDDHLRAVGQVDDKVAADRVDVAQIDSGGKRDDTVGAGHDALRTGLDDDRRRRGREALRGGHMGVADARSGSGELMLVMKTRLALRSAQRSFVVSHVLPFRHHGPRTGSMSRGITCRLTETVNVEVGPRASTRIKTPTADTLQVSPIWSGFVQGTYRGGCGRIHWLTTLRFSYRIEDELGISTFSTRL